MSKYVKKEKPVDVPVKGGTKKAIIDKFINSYLSRKLIVFIITCFGLFTSYITSSDFVLIAGIYLSSQGIIDAIISYKTKGGGSDPSMM